MNRAAKLLVLTIGIAAAAVLLAMSRSPLVALTSHQVVGLAAFAFLAISSEVLATNFASGPGRHVKSSIAFIPVLACALVFPGILVLLTVTLVAVATQVFRRTRNVWVGAFNVFQSALVGGCAALIYNTIASWTSFVDPVLGISVPSFPGRVNVLAFAATASAFFGLNILLVTGFMAARQGGGWFSIVGKAIGPGGGNLLYDLLASPLAVFAAFVYMKLSGPGLVMVALPLFLVRYSYISQLQLARVNKDLLFVLVKAIETRDAYTSGHSLRVASLARGIAQDLGFRRRALDNLETAALLHDIGKIEALYIPVLAKPFELSSDERALIRTHALKGSQILLNLSAFSEDIIRAVRHHHEWYDGSGYPDGLRGTDIPLSARIIMACDAIDAMLSDRPYRDALPVNAVEAELRRCSGSQFDPELVSVILQKGTLYRVAAERAPQASTALTLVAGGR